MEEWLDLSSLIEQVQELFDMGLYDKGKTLLDEYAEIYDSDWEIHFLYSRAFAEQNEPQKAIPHLVRALKLDKNNPDCLLGLFYAYVQLNKIKAGVKYLHIARKHFPDNELILNALIWYYTEINDYNKAIELYENSKSILDYNSEALRNIGIAYERSGNYSKALICYKMSLELNPDMDETRDLLADHYILRGEPHKSIELYKEYLKKSPRNIRALSRLVFCFTQDDNLNEAENVARQIIETYPNSTVGYVELAYVFLHMEEIQKAITTADKALDVSPIDPEALRVKGIAYSELKDHSSAEEYFKEALSLAPDNPEIMRDYYHHLRSAEKDSEMLAMVLKVIELEHPYCTEDYWFLADYYKEKKQNVKAFHYLIKAYRSMPGEQELIPKMAEILFDSGHLYYATPILKYYIESKGWDETMKAFMKHKRLQGKWSQEGLRFLQFYGQKSIEFRKYIFSTYTKKFLKISFYLIFAFFIMAGFFFLSVKGLLITVVVFLISLTSIKTCSYLLKKKKIT